MYYPKQKVPLTLCLIISYIYLLSGCATMEPKGRAAAEIADLGWVMFGLGSVIWVGVTALLVIGLFRRKRANGDIQTTPRSSE